MTDQPAVRPWETGRPELGGPGLGGPAPEGPGPGPSGQEARRIRFGERPDRQIAVRTLNGLDQPIGSTAGGRLATSARVETAGTAPVRERRDGKVVLARTKASPWCELFLCQCLRRWPKGNHGPPPRRMMDARGRLGAGRESGRG